MQETTRAFDALMPSDMAAKAETVGVAKANLPLVPMFVLAVLAGAFISLGAVFATSVSAGGGVPFGIAKMFAGLVFCVGLVLVVVAGAELFTGNNLIVMAFASRKVSLAKLLRCWGIVYAGNLVGSLLTAVMVYVGQHHTFGGGAVGLTALEIARSKTSLDFLQAIALGILCNALVCLAVWLCMSARTTTDKILAVIFPIAAFVASGFEHCVANMYFIPEGLLIKSGASADFWSSIGRTAADYGDLTWSSFALANLLPVTIGNIIGGSVLVGLVYWFVYLRPRPPDTA